MSRGFRVCLATGRLSVATAWREEEESAMRELFNLTSSSPPLPTASGAGSQAQAQGFIILETNYRLYAYTGTCQHMLFAVIPTTNTTYQIIPFKQPF